MTHTSFSANLSAPTRAAIVIVLISAVAAVGYVAVNRFKQPDLERRLDLAHTLLEQARTTGTVPYNAETATWTVPSVDRVEEQKLIFMGHVLPLIAQENHRIKLQRNIIETSQGPAQIRTLATAYGLPDDDFSRKRLLRRVDVLPVSLVLAQAAIESGWGTSRFAQQGHAYFGERTYDESVPGISPKRASGFKVKSFDNAALSVRSYMRTLNSHRAYQTLREHRAALRAQGKAPSGLDLAAYLKQYSEIGGNYVERIRATIRTNDLQVFDNIRVITDEE